MNDILASAYLEIAACLRLSALDVVQLADRRWQFALENGARATASADDAFLRFDAPAPLACELAGAPQWLRWHAALAGNSKFVLVPEPWRLRLRAEMPLVDDANTPARVAETVRGLNCACQLLEGTQPLAGDFRQGVVAGDSAEKSPNLMRLLRETGWSFQERPGGVVTVEIASRGEGCRVLLEESARGLRAAVEFLQVDSPASDSRLTMEALLLCASGALRLARPYAADAGEKFTCGFEVQFAGETSAGELEHALEALAVACWACKEEVHSLLDNSVAAGYMATANFPLTLPREEF